MRAPTDPPHEREVAAAALVELPEIRPGVLRAVVERWPDPRVAVREILRLSGELARVAEAAGAARSRQTDGAELVRLWAGAIDLDRTRARLTRRGTRVLACTDDVWPIEAGLPRTPALLLVEGRRSDALERPRVAVVGTRAATPNGIDDAFEIGRHLAGAGVTVVSGLAIGIDGAAHGGSVAGGGPTIAVMATGLDVVYPRRHDGLARDVHEHGLLVSEVPFGTRPDRGRFPVRNRIIAALADVVVVVEATATGGARITADHALDYGRPVLAVPGSRRNPSAAGCNALIADGAQPLLDPDDVLLALGMTPGERRAVDPRSDRPALQGDASAVHRALGGEPATLDQLTARTGLAAPQVSMAVTRLVRDGWATRDRGMVWPR